MVRKEDRSASAASVLELLSLEAVAGTELVLSATGVEAQEALDALSRLFDSDFQEC